MISCSAARRRAPSASPSAPARPANFAGGLARHTAKESRGGTPSVRVNGLAIRCGCCAACWRCRQPRHLRPSPPDAGAARPADARGRTAGQDQRPLHAPYFRQPAWPAGGRESAGPAVCRGSSAPGLGRGHHLRANPRGLAAPGRRDRSAHPTGSRCSHIFRCAVVHRIAWRIPGHEMTERRRRRRSLANGQLP